MNKLALMTLCSTVLLVLCGCPLTTSPAEKVKRDPPVVPFLQAPYSVNPVDSGLATDVKWHRVATRYRGFNSSTDTIIKGWAHAIAIESALGAKPDPLVEMDYLQVSVYRDGKWVVVLREEYSGEYFSTSNGCLFLRENWSYTMDGSPLPAEVYGNYLKIRPFSTDYIYHWWTRSSNDIQQGDSFKVDARIRISGGALCQIGVDLKLYDDQDKVSPALVTDWYGPTDGKWITISNQYIIDAPDAKPVPVKYTFSVPGVSIANAWITADWTAWGVWQSKPMMLSGGEWHYMTCHPSGTKVYFNFSYSANSVTYWATDTTGLRPNMNITCTTNGLTIPVSMLSNGFGGYNCYIVIP